MRRAILIVGLAVIACFPQATRSVAHSLTLALRPILARKGITLHGVYPGGIDTDMLAGVDRRLDGSCLPSGRVAGRGYRFAGLSACCVIQLSGTFPAGFIILASSIARGIIQLTGFRTCSVIDLTSLGAQLLRSFF